MPSSKHRSRRTVVVVMMLLVTILSCLSSVCWGWNCPGHMLTAHVARRLIGDDVANYFDPFIKEFGAHYENVNTMTEAACWADDIKGLGIKKYSNWHFADLCYSVDGTPCPPPGVTDGKLLQVLPEIIYNMTTVQDPETFAFNLFFTLHLVGDLHQPLHCTTEFSHRFPHGDHGGNEFKVEYYPESDAAEKTQGEKEDVHHQYRLHEYCDDIGLQRSLYIVRPLTGDKLKYMDYVVDTLLDFKFPEEEIAFYNATTITDWANEIFSLGKTAIYENGDLKPNTVLSHAYVQSSRNVLMRQLSRGGQRLANVLKWIYDSVKNQAQLH